jgi:glc operon protein GlcG
MEIAVKATKRHGVPGAIAIVDSGVHLMLFERLDETMHAAASIAIGKAFTAVAFQRSTKDIEKTILNGRSPMLMANNATSQAYIPFKGGHPIFFENEIIGGIAVTGTMDADLDETIALEALRFEIQYNNTNENT